MVTKKNISSVVYWYKIAGSVRRPDNQRLELVHYKAIKHNDTADGLYTAY